MTGFSLNSQIFAKSVEYKIFPDCSLEASRVSHKKYTLDPYFEKLLNEGNANLETAWFILSNNESVEGPGWSDCVFIAAHKKHLRGR